MRAPHPVADRVPDDPAGAGVFDRAHVQLAVAGGVFGDIGKPQLVRRVGGEDAVDKVIVDRRSRLLSPALLLAERAPPSVVAADPPSGAVGHRRSGAAGFIGEEAVPELRVISVRVEQGIGPVGLGELSAGDGVTKPPVARVASELEYSASSLTSG